MFFSNIFPHVYPNSNIFAPFECQMFAIICVRIYVIADEFPPPAVAYERGVIAMANRGPGTTGSQFFVMLADAGLPPQYSIFGWVTEGLEILDLLQQVPLGQSPTSPDPTPSTPLETIYIDSVTIQN